MKTQFKKKVLSNGMTILFEKRNLPTVSVAFAVRNGGINETSEEKGISHFIEHMLYKGTTNRTAKQIAEEIEKNGGVINGFTSDVITAYWCKMPSEHLKIALDVLSDIIKNPLFDEKELEKEKAVVFEEISMRKDNPMMYSLIKNQTCLFKSPVGDDVVGTIDSVNSISKEIISKKFKQIYSPNNMILCVVGDANFKEVIKFAEKNFGNTQSKVPKIKVEQKNEIKVEKRKGITQASLVFSYHIPIVGNKLNFAAQILGTIMTGGMSSRLFSEIREKRNLAYAIKGSCEMTKKYAYNLIYVGTTPENVKIVKKIILDEFKKVSKNLDEKELKEIKKQMIGNYKIVMEDSQTQMLNLMLLEIADDAKKFYEFEKNISEVKLKDVKKLANIKNYSMFTLVPE